MSDDRRPLIVADGLTKSLSSGEVVQQVLRGVSLEIERGSFSAVVGPSGCGKTTFLSLLAGLDVADGGRLTVDGLELRGLSSAKMDAYRRDKVGIVLQFYSLLPSLNALENVETSLEFLPLTAAQRTARARDYLDRVGLADAAAKFPAQLSGGMQQRVAVARALAREPALLLADEPTGALDQESGLQVFECLRALQASTGVTCVLVTHDPLLAAKTQRTIRFEDGRVKEA